MIRFALLFLTCLLLAAHHMRAGEPGLVVMWLTVPLLPLVRRRFVPYLIAAVCLAGAGVWAATAWQIAQTRIMLGQPWMRSALILGAVGTVTVAAGAWWLTDNARARFADRSKALIAPLVTAALTGGLLTYVLLRVPTGAILFERFLVGAGWLQILWITVYAGWLADTVSVPKDARRWRPRIWVLFSIIFYAQLMLGVMGVERLLMTGKLHLPIPAIIAAGPIFRGHGFFMAILFGVSVILVGPAWCSWLCYLGGWDGIAAQRQRWAGTLPPWRSRFRLGMVIGVLGVALVLGLVGVPGTIAAALGGAFGIAGVVIMATMSRHRGVMVHCTSYCPIGWFATRLGKINPFRIVIDQDCNECMACTRFCRYDALNPQNILDRRVGQSCTLCGDCVTVCQKTHDIHYAFPGLSAERARTVFLVLAVAMHASFMGIAMI